MSLRKTFRYPADEDPDQPTEGIDEQGKQFVPTTTMDILQWTASLLVSPTETKRASQ